jgi:hypothetical protein
MHDICIEVGGVFQTVISIYDKESCLGHTETGAMTCPNWADNLGELDLTIKAYTTFFERGNLIIDGSKFATDLSEISGGLNTPWGITTTGGASIISRNGGIEIGKVASEATTLLQRIQFLITKKQGIEYGQTYIFYLRYFGFSGNANTASFRIQVRIKLPDSGNWSWNFDTRRWVSGTTQSKQITLHSQLYKTNFDIDVTHPTRFLTDVKFDEFYDTITFSDAAWTDEMLLFGVDYKLIRFMEVLIYSPNTDNSNFIMRVDQIGMIKYLPTERFGGFPSMPTSSFWMA